MKETEENGQRDAQLEAERQSCCVPWASNPQPIINAPGPKRDIADAGADGNDDYSDDEIRQDRITFKAIT